MAKMKPPIDESLHHCSCGKSFTMADYPAGYFFYKKQIRPGNHANVCPSCEADILEDTLELMRKPPLHQRSAKEARRHDKSVGELKEDIQLLRTKEIRTERHARNILKVYDDVLTSEHHTAIYQIISRLSSQ